MRFRALTSIRNPLLEPISQRGHLATTSGHNVISILKTKWDTAMVTVKHD